MNLAYIALGFVIGALLAGGGSWLLLGAVGGAVIGGLLARLVLVERRIEKLESERPEPEPDRTGAPGARASDASVDPTGHGHLPEAAESPGPGLEHPDGPAAADLPPGDAWPEEHVRPAPAEGPLEGAPQAGGRPAGTVIPSEAGAGSGEAARADAPGAGGDDTARRPSQPSLAEVGLRRAAHWFTTGNVPVKVGVILSFIGVAFLMKYAIDRELLAVPIEIRLLGAAAGALVMLGVGWRLRERMPVYALSLQGGAAGILFLVIFGAYRLWSLIPAGLAFVLLVTLAAATGALAVLQRSRTLIVLGVAGGFLAPVLASTGQGSHVALFSYYLVLNATILGVAWFRAWRELNLVGFVFTFVIGSLWGYRYYRPELFASTEPFLVLYFLFYTATAVLYALRRAPDRVGTVDGTLVFGTPVIAFALQAALLRDSEYGLAISAAVLALFYIAVAWLLFRRPTDAQRAYLRMLTESFVSLAVAFATLAIPLALDARWTSAAWALEGAALVWVGTRQGRHLATLAGAALIGFSGIALMGHGWHQDRGWPVLNANVLGGLMVALSSLFAAYRLERFDRAPLEKLYQLMSWLLFGWGVLWWLGTGGAEINDRLARDWELHAWLLFVALTTLAAGWLGMGHRWCRAGQLTVLYLPMLVLTALLYLSTAPNHFLLGAGWPAWPVAFAVQAWVLRRMDQENAPLAMAWHVTTVLVLAGMLSVEAAWQTDRLLAGDWDRAAASFVPGFVALLILRWRDKPAWPVPAHPVAYRGAAWLLVVLQALYLAAVSIERPGDPAPLTYLPVLNPFDLALLYSLLVAWVTLAMLRGESDLLADSVLRDWQRPLQIALGLAFFVITTAALVRGVHHIAGVPWVDRALFTSERVQTALSIYWGLLGFAGMVGGARRGLRPLWLGGAGFMALVVLKLFVVDLGNSGTVERIVSFIGIGILLLVVGYFAPVPPRQDGSGSAEETLTSDADDAGKSGERPASEEG